MAKKLPSFGPDVGHALIVGRPNNNDGDGQHHSKSQVKKAFKFVFGDRNLRLRDSAFVPCAPQQMVTEMT